MKLFHPLAVRIGALPWIPRYTRHIVAVDHAIQKISKGRVTLLTVAGLPELTLTVKGRKTGIERRTPLLCVPLEKGWVVAGSNWGSPEAPAWSKNLKAADRAEVQYEGKTTPVAVRLVDGTEREELWRAMVDVWPNYPMYAARTDRVIPIFVLTPVAE